MGKDEGRTPEGYILVCLATSAQVEPVSADGTRIEEGVKWCDAEGKLEGRKDTPGEDRSAGREWGALDRRRQALQSHEFVNSHDRCMMRQ